MPKDNRPFINPLTRPSMPGNREVEESPAAAPTTQAAPTQTAAPAPTTSGGRSRRKELFEKRHERTTIWVEKRLKQQFEMLADREGTSKTALLNEALADLLKKYSQS